jgi:predicted deacylase
MSRRATWVPSRAKCLYAGSRMKDLSHFPKNYSESRQRFRAAADQVAKPARTGEWAIPGTQDRDLFVDHLWLPPLKEGKKLFVITSGVHGSESYAGTAIQQMFLSEILPTLDRSHVGIFLAHALNPFGFKHHQRCTEDGINLNRNFSVSGEMYKFKNEASFRFNEMFLPKKPVDSLKSYLLTKLEMKNGEAFFDGISFDTLVKGIAPGQFHQPEHVEFGGRALAPQSAKFIETMREIMPGFRDIVGLDLHTGLGDRGRLHLLAGGGHERVDESLFNEIFDPRNDHEHYVFTPPEAEGFYEVYGGINAAFVELAKAPQRVCAVTVEFGTLGHSLEKQIEGLNSFFLEQQGRYYGYASPQLKTQILAENFARSFPHDDEWRLMIMKAARETFNRAFKRALSSI